MSARTKPPFRADHVGSILRSAAIQSARAKRQKGEITAAELKAVDGASGRVQVLDMFEGLCVLELPK